MTILSLNLGLQTRLWGFFETQTFLIHQVFCGRRLCLSWLPGLTGCYEERGAFCSSHHLGHLKLIIWSWLRHKASLHEKSPRQTARQYGGCCPAGRTHDAGMCLIKRQMPYFEFVFATLQGGVTAIVLLYKWTENTNLHRCHFLLDLMRVLHIFAMLREVA